MSRLKQFLRKSKKNQDEEEEAHEKPIKPVKGWRRILTTFNLYFPLGMFQRALEWKLVSTIPSITNEAVKNNEAIEVEEVTRDNKVISIQEKSFRTRFGYFSTRTFLQSFGLSIIFTAPISLPWIFNVVIPFTIDLLPLGLSDVIRDIINAILAFLSPLVIVVEIIMMVSNFVGTYNPIFFYGSTLWILSMLGLTDVEDVFKNSENNGAASMVELMANHFQSKFVQIQDFIVLFLIFVAGSISFFLIVRRARSILFEIQTEKEQLKTIGKIKRTLISYYLDDGYSHVEYTENRISSSPKLMWLARLTKYGPIVSVVLPISLAIIFIIL